MAKDGTNRGGARPGAGRPRKALTEKIAEGKSAEVMMQPADIESAETPPVRDFMKEIQRDGTKLLADDVYTETYQWLKERSCEKIVSRQLVEQYAMSISRWIHCEQIVTKYGYISKHPTTGAAIASPYVAMSQNYMKQANQIWNQIFQIVRENCSVEFQGNPQEDMMEKLLRSRSEIYMKADNNFWRELKQQRNNMTKQQYCTIKGQAVKGNIDAARKGMLRIQQRRNYR